MDASGALTIVFLTGFGRGFGRGFAVGSAANVGLDPASMGGDVASSSGSEMCFGPFGQAARRFAIKECVWLAVGTEKKVNERMYFQFSCQCSKIK
jgi:hypothetical protein